MNILRQNKEIHPIISIPNFLSDLEINQIFDLSKEKEFIDAAIGNKLNEKENHNLLTDHKIINPNVGVVKRKRETNLKWISLDKNSNWLFKKIIQCINETNANNYGYILRFLGDLQFLEYTSQTKGFYSKHNDCGNRFGIENFVGIRKLSFTIQLSDSNDYEGGELKFYTGKKSIYTNKAEGDTAKKDKGTIIFFPSHVLHEVTPVTKGIRYSLVSWVQGPNIL